MKKLTKINSLKNYFSGFISLFYPQLCVLCKRVLTDTEKHLCLHCLLQLPKTNYHLQADSTVEDRFKGKIPYKKISSYLFYNKGGRGAKIIEEIKYKGNTGLGRWISESMAREYLSSGFFDGIDLLVPVPLHKKRLKKRGFNQAEIIAKSISSITGIPVNTTTLYRKVANITQTKKGNYDRWLNTMDIFALNEEESFAGKQILLIDDVLTTGSTLEACCKSSLQCKNTSVSVLTLSVTQ